MSGFAAAILAGGASRRMGCDKALVAVDGEAMAARVGRVLDEAGASEVVMVGGPARPLPWRHVADLHPGDGPLGGLLSALAALEHELILVTACDLPWLDVVTVRAVVDALGADGGIDVAMARTERPEPLCAAWRRTTTEPVLAASFARGERAIHRALDGLRRVDVPVRADVLRNVNTPEDLPDAGG
jgi:molybdopterin-guanine dinucleotide biosynthesis protein A